MAYVIDTSALAKLVLDDKGWETFRAWFEQEEETQSFEAPPLIAYELGRAIQRRMAGSKPRLMAEAHRQCLKHVRIVEPGSLAVFETAARGVTYYDACFLALALERRATLVTADGEMARQARKGRLRVETF